MAAIRKQPTPGNKISALLIRSSCKAGNAVARYVAHQADILWRHGRQLRIEQQLSASVHVEGSPESNSELYLHSISSHLRHQPSQSACLQSQRAVMSETAMAANSVVRSPSS